MSPDSKAPADNPDAAASGRAAGPSPGPSPGPSIGRQAWRAAWPAVALALLALVPFLDKAFNIDDLTFLLEAQHALVDPLHPAAFDMIFHGNPSRVSSGLVSGPVMAYLLVPSVLRGGAEWIAHVPQMILLALGAVATAALALRLGVERRFAGVAALLVVIAPAVLAMATTAMPDVPAMTFGAMAMERLCAWRASRRISAALLATVALTLAVLSRPQLVLLLGVGALLLVEGQRWSWRRWWTTILRRGWPLALSVVLLVVINYATRDREAGHDVAKITLARMNFGYFSANLTSFFAHWAFSLPLVLPWVALNGRRMAKTRWLYLVAAGGALLPVLASQWRWLWYLAPVCGVSAATFADLLADGWRRRDVVRLALVGWLLMGAPTALYDHLPPKYLVPSVPAAAVVVAGALGRVPWRRALRTVGITAVVGLLVGWLVIRADAALAEVGRHGAAQFVAPAVARGERVWADGAWGFQWYAMQAGARPMRKYPPLPEAGDLVVRGVEGGRVELLANRRLLHRRVVDEPGGRVHSWESGAGFYTNHVGFLPWGWGSDEIARIEVWRVTEAGGVVE